MPFLCYLTPTSVIGLAAILLFSYYILKRKKSPKAKKAPEVGGAWPLIGHLRLLAGPELPHKTFSALADKYGPIFTIRVGLYPTLVVNSWELAKELYTTHDAIISSRPQLIGAKLLGYNFASFGFAPYGEYWRQMRKLTASELLSNHRLELLKHIRASEVETAVKDLYKLWDKNKNEDNRILVEMKQWFADINLNVIFRMIAGNRYLVEGAMADKKQVRRCQKVMREFFHLAGVFVPRDAVPFLGWLDIGGYEKAMKRAAKEMDSIISEWLEEHSRMRDSGDHAAANQVQDFMDVLLFALDDYNHAGFDADTVRKATASMILVGATDTTTVTVTWGLALLLNNATTLRKGQEELDAQVGRERLVNESDIDNLPYFQSTVKEILRLYPAGALASREFTAGCTVGGYDISPGTRLLVNLNKIQRDPRIWSDPLEFKPERFLTTHKEFDVKGQNFELIPFGAGRRICPGMNFGIQMTHLVLASFLQAFEVTNPSNAPVDMTETAGVTNSKATPLEVLVKPRLPAHVYT
ncbi:hypothetical protein Tsubulata_809278 [Turnera subulata]|uniref:Cytochrome P450 CYP82D47-like n=1 Tax=Turnera subulata TaxID=218843 RepID=A0A9Q0J572_9ROSI|nr:hypothetical protein Tsubulata_809278 [Turnera subulata]